MRLLVFWLCCIAGHVPGEFRDRCLSTVRHCPTAAKFVLPFADAAAHGREFVIDIGPAADGRDPEAHARAVAFPFPGEVLDPIVAKRRPDVTTASIGAMLQDGKVHIGVPPAGLKTRGSSN